MKQQRDYRDFFQTLLKDLTLKPDRDQIEPYAMAPSSWQNYTLEGPTPRTPSSQTTMWLANGDQMNYKLYPKLNSRPKTIKDELGFQSYGSYFPTAPPSLDTDPLKFSPLPPFKNEFADWKPTSKHSFVSSGPPPPLPPSRLSMRQPPGYKPNEMPKYCTFCKKNGELAEMYMSHQLFDQKMISCPVLATCVCPQCGNTGHTLSYCPRPAETQACIVRMMSEHNKVEQPSLPF